VWKLGERGGDVNSFRYKVGGLRATCSLSKHQSRMRKKSGSGSLCVHILHLCEDLSFFAEWLRGEPQRETLGVRHSYTYTQAIYI
jgi:hypothetical protein